MASVTAAAILEAISLICKLLLKIPEWIENAQEHAKDAEYQKQKAALHKAVDDFVLARKSKDVKGQLEALKRIK